MTGRINPVDQRSSAPANGIAWPAALTGTGQLDKPDRSFSGGRPGLAGIKMGIDLARKARRSARQRDRDLPFEIEPTVIVQSVSRVLQPIADEHHLGRHLAVLVGYAWPKRRVLPRFK